MALAFLMNMMLRALNASPRLTASAARRNMCTYSERMDKTGRPISPHIFIYKFPTIAISSVMVRATGMMLTFGTCLLAHAFPPRVPRVTASRARQRHPPRVSSCSRRHDRHCIHRRHWWRRLAGFPRFLHRQLIARRARQVCRRLPAYLPLSWRRATHRMGQDRRGLHQRSDAAVELCAHRRVDRHRPRPLPLQRAAQHRGQQKVEDGLGAGAACRPKLAARTVQCRASVPVCWRMECGPSADERRRDRRDARERRDVESGVLLM